MHTREPYPTLRRGREVLRQQEAELWERRTARLRRWQRKLAHWLGTRLIRWGQQLEHASMLDEIPSLEQEKPFS